MSDRFYVGGRLYDDWASVPPEFKVPAGSALDIGAPKPAAFTFRFKL